MSKQTPVKPNPTGNPDCLDSRTMVEALDRFATTFQTSARRWELVVYPALFAFVVLAGYGFFLIYSLTRDANQITHQMAQVTGNMAVVTRSMEQVAAEMGRISGQVGSMSQDTAQLTAAINEMNQQIYTMNQNVALMTGSMNRMGADMGNLNYNVGKPARFMNNFLPW